MRYARGLIDVAIALIAALFIACTLCGQELTIKGDVRIVEVDRVIVVKDKVQVVSTFPFTINAPAGGLLYAWKVPATLTAIERGNVLEVTAAPKGNLIISVQWPVIDWDARKVENKSASISFAIGEPGPGPPDPKPPEPKPDVFTQSLIDAYRTDATPEKAKVVAFFASLYRAAAKTEVNDPTLATLVQLYNRLVSARQRVYPDNSVILPIRKLIEAELNALIKPVSDQPLDAATREKAAAAFNRIATALEAIK